ncbi:MAG: 1,4-dihydroxy-2-naphthoate octaprenyltransferase [Pseudomonadota bacterium]
MMQGEITWDLEGRIQTFNQEAAKLFDYQPEEVIGKKRFFIFFPGLVVIGHIGQWLKKVHETGELSVKTPLLRKNKTSFAAELRIKSTFQNDKPTGFVGTVSPLTDVPVDSIMPEISNKTRFNAWIAILRAPFLTATVVPILIGAAWAAYQHQSVSFPWGIFVLVLIGGVLLHVAANTFNDYYDWRSGTDPANNDYFQPFSGGSRSMELGLISERGLFHVAFGALVLASLIGVLLVFFCGPYLLLFGIIGAFSAFFYTAPPLRLSARKGLGELFVGLNFGPLVVGGTVYSLTGSLSFSDFAVGIPIGLLTTAILWVNQFPDAKTDAATGKNHLVVLLGNKHARWGYLFLLTLSFALIALGTVSRVLPLWGLLAFLPLPLAIYATSIVFRHYNDRSLIRASAATIKLHMSVGLCFAVGLFVSSFF